jgi:hypothetical protein
VKLYAVLATLKAARINRVGALCAAGLALVGVLLTTVLKPETLAAACQLKMMECEVAASPSAAPAPTGSPAGSPTPEPSAGAVPVPTTPPGTNTNTNINNNNINTGHGNIANNTGTGSDVNAGKNTGTGAGSDNDPSPDTGTGDTGAGDTGGGIDQEHGTGTNPQVSGGTAPTVHDGPHSGRISWQPVISTDIDDIGFRHGTEGDLFASPEGISSEHGVRIVRVRESDVGYTRCRAVQYTAADTVILAGNLALDDYICAYDTVQYTAAYRIVGLPSPQEPFYRVIGTSWSD